MTEKKNDVTLLVCSCDTYEDAWYPYFKLKNTYWPDCPYPVLLNTESKSFSFEGVTIPTLNLYAEGEKVVWGKRMHDHLERIETKYVLVMLEDYFLVETVAQSRLDQCVEWMEADSSIMVFNFMPVDDPANVPSDRYQGFEKRPQRGAYRYNCQAALWNREKLLRTMRSYESPWEWEVYGNRRSYRDFSKYYVQTSDSVPILNYNYHTDGSPIYRGRWHLKYVADLFEKNNIHMDYSLRGTVEDRSTAPANAGLVPPLPLWKRICDPLYPIYNKLKHIRNYF